MTVVWYCVCALISIMAFAFKWYLWGSVGMFCVLVGYVPILGRQSCFDNNFLILVMSLVCVFVALEGKKNKENSMLVKLNPLSPKCKLPHWVVLVMSVIFFLSTVLVLLVRFLGWK